MATASKTVFHTLKVHVIPECPNREAVLDFYRNHIPTENSGVDVIFPQEFRITRDVQLCKMGIKCVLILDGEINPSAYYFLPRSSISKTPIRMANSVGVIDSSYRGEIMAPLESRTDFTVGDHHGTLKLLQIVAPDLKPIKVVVVEADELGETARGEGSFGSTNAR